MKPKAEAGTYAAMAVGLAVLVACAGSVAPLGPRASPSPPLADTVPSAAPAPGVRPAGFLSPGMAPDAAAIIPPAPREGDARNTLDWDVFEKTRALEGGDRWKLAQADDAYGSAYLLSAFSCAVGVAMSPDTSPLLSDILRRVTIDAGLAAEGAKQLYRRPRPFTRNDGDICITRSAGLEASFDYPSGHASIGWMAGLVLAQLAPDRASQILARGRAYGESRVICGVHNLSAVEAARTNAASVFAALQGSTAYLDALAEARTEMSRVRSSGPNPESAVCAAEAKLTAPLMLP
jgi:acid phosphatase (class A)